MMRRADGCGLALGLAWALSGCGAPAEAGPAGGHPVSTDVSGSAQKGPFSSGSQITIAELDAQLVQTGRTFSTTMSGNGGVYSVRGVQLGTPFARIEVNGFYFDEVRGELSASPLSLFSYVDLSNPGSTNINLLGHLEAARLEHLVSSSGLSFASAKAQAHREVLELFQLDPAIIGSAEALDISQDGVGNAALFAISIMLQGTRTVGELSELLANIQNDLRQDGTLDDPESGAALLEAAAQVDLERARENLSQRFEEAGVDAAVPEIDSHIDRFTEEAPFVYDGGRVHYPIIDLPNVLDPGLTRFVFNPQRPGLRFVADMPAGVELEIRMTNHSVTTREIGTTNIWTFNGNHQPIGWAVSNYDFDTGVQTFRATQPGLIEMEYFSFHGAGTATLEYFEGGSSTPTRVKEIAWSDWNSSYQQPRPLNAELDPIAPVPGTGGAGPDPRPPAGGYGGDGSGGYGGDGSGGASGNGGYGGDGSGGYAGAPPRPDELCGNGVIDMGEDCDGADLQGATCESLRPGTSGTVRCEPYICRISDSECRPTCGNGVVDSGEACDPGAWAPQECSHCNPECQIEERPCP